MDPLSIGASVVAFVGLADKVIRAARFCMDSLQDAPSDIQMIVYEVSSLRTIVEILTAQDPHRLIPSGKKPIFDVVPTFSLDWAGPIEACHRCLSSLAALLPPGAGAQKESIAPKRRRITLAELAWPLKQSKARKLLAEVSQHKATLLLAISGDVM